jgi:hypothetical protein
MSLIVKWFRKATRVAMAITAMGYSGKTVLTDSGKLELAIPRNRHRRFGQVLIGKLCLPKTISGMTHARGCRTSIACCWCGCIDSTRRCRTRSGVDPLS